MPAKNPPVKKIKTFTASDLVTRTINAMESKFGPGSAITPRSDTVLCKVETWASCGNFLINQAIAGGNSLIPGGIPFGRLTEIAGRNGSGKTTCLGHSVASTQRMGGIACVGDTEQALDLGYWAKLGVNLDHLVLFQAECIEEVFDKMVHLIHTIKGFQANVPILIGWDSLGGTPTKAQLEADSDQHFYAEAAKVVGKNLQRVMALISKERIALVFVNHLYRDINVKYGDPWQSYGGEKVQFYSSLRIRLVKGAPIKEGGGKKEDDDKDDDKDTIGHLNRIQILKNKMAPVLRTVKVPCLGNHGFCEDYSVFDQGIKLKILEKSGAWAKWQVSEDEEVNFQGWAGFQEKVVKHPQYKELVSAIKDVYAQTKTFEE
jgi:recombination protein RecA